MVLGYYIFYKKKSLGMVLGYYSALILSNKEYIDARGGAAST